MESRLRILVITLVSFLALSFLPSIIQANDNEEEMKEYIKNEYVDELDPTLLEHDLPTILNHLDVYSTYFSKEELRDFKNRINRKYVGIGIAVAAHDEGLQVSEVYKHTPAEKAGIKVGTIILSVNGIILKREDLEQSIAHLSGEPDSTLTITVLQDSKTKTLTLTREEIQLPAVTGKRIGGKTGYLKIHMFSSSTLAELERLSQSMGNVSHWIIDLRNNPGGYLTAAQQVLGLFPSVKTAMHAQFRDNTYQYSASDLTYKLDHPTSLLINENSASASEIVAGALKDYKAATLYGETTFGKGLMQELKEFSDGSGVKLSIARFFTPQHNTINEVGVEPDIPTSTPLLDAHSEALKELSYDRFNKLSVDRDKTFTINTNTSVNMEELQAAIHLFPLGGTDLPFTLNQEDADTFVLDPDQDLELNQTYRLLIEPGWRGTNGISSTKGILQPISVHP
ncbi:S41 family peptidase [Pontibacillus sp. ALD_SL1]|uniref:S41 family peptidase n=1 Tax=Pontibacillus sp. ALD_SL1 TaxID=2777185 RepID=UPI001A96C4DE|nr:S41 family peptidase [Pontibacillus sp. ALD_SL1]QSS99633.1 S41 family peptidase [Pontibacillus sp. ALD_SL1]